MKTLSDKIVDRLRESSATYEEIYAWAKGKFEGRVRFSQIDTGLQKAIDDGQIRYARDHKYQVIIGSRKDIHVC